jgi:HAD superfamily 5'-nucleotidase-like hydrolase
MLNHDTGASREADYERSDTPPRRRVFTNRNLRMDSIGAIGFDMDHTVAVYNTENFNHLSFEMAIEALIRDKGYPTEIRSLDWEPEAAVRGLVVDKRLGNLLKIDAYNHVTRARHGRRFLDREERRRRYPSGGIRLGSKRYRVFDTLFDLPEGSLYGAMVHLLEKSPGLLDIDFHTLFDDIRQAVDTLHADGSLKARITADLDSYFLKDTNLVPTLAKYREAGKKLFLLTNSEVSYTAAVMDHLVGGEQGSWEDLFDLVVCFARKPGFFLKRGDGEPVEKDSCPRMPNRNGHCYVGGDSFFLEKLIGARGDEILYFGDHTYGDILRSKKSVGWRTAMIVPEVEEEVWALRPLRDDWQALAVLEDRLEDIVMERDRLRALPNGQKDAAARIAELDKLAGDALGQRARLQRKLRSAFNPHWESLFREGRAASRLGRQIMEFACIYTSRVSNFLNYPTDKFFARPVEVLPHERWALPEA